MVVSWVIFEPSQTLCFKKAKVVNCGWCFDFLTPTHAWDFYNEFWRIELVIVPCKSERYLIKYQELFLDVILQYPPRVVFNREEPITQKLLHLSSRLYRLGCYISQSKVVTVFRSFLWFSWRSGWSGEVPPDLPGCPKCTGLGFHYGKKTCSWWTN